MSARPLNAGERLLDAAALAAKLGVSRSYIYEHAEMLGAIPIGAGPRPRLRFNVAIVAERLAANRNPESPKPARPRRRRRPVPERLLPIRGKDRR
jgi:hypothetical protein